MFKDEEWRPVVNLEHYRVSNYGRVKKIDSEEARKPYTSDAGFPCIVLYGKDSKSRYMRQINVLVAQAFLYPARFPNETSVWHLDGDLTNCRANNLRWDTRARTIEWNKMHRPNARRIPTPRVKNNRTGVIYADAFECGLAEGRLESEIIIRIERQARHQEDDNARYRYLYKGQD